MDISSDGFSLVWLYWYRRYIRKVSADCPHSQQLEQNQLFSLKKLYLLEAVESYSTHGVEQRLATAKSSHSAVEVYLVDPEKEVKQIQQVLTEKPESSELLNELFSYYLNSGQIFVIHRSDASSASSNNNLRSLSSSNGEKTSNNSDNNNRRKADTHLSDNDDHHNNREKLDLANSDVVNKIFHEEDSVRNESMPEIYHKLEHRIQGLEILDLLASFEGAEIWNCKYKNMAHSFIKIKDPSWSCSIKLPLMHPSQPKTVGELPILPRINRLRPSLDKLLPFVSYVKLLDKYFANFSTSVSSIFEFNNLPYVFVQEDSQGACWTNTSNIGLLCYFVVFGDHGGTLTVKQVERWTQDNQKTVLATTIKQMNKRQRERAKLRRQNDSKSLIFLDPVDANELIW